MTSRYEAFLNGVALQTISPDILIHDISYGAPSFQDDTFSVAKRNGSRIFRRSFDSISVTIKFEIHAYSVARRQAICQAVCLWAKSGGELKTNDREGQYLQCVCSQFPTIESARNWTDPLTIVFTAYAVPFWQDVAVTSVALTAGSSGSKSAFVPGNADGALVEAEVTAGGSLTTLNLTVNGRTLTLSGISVSSGSKVVISYDTDGIQSIKVGSTSLLNKRSGVDDLLANCGAINTFGFSANVSVTVNFKIKGVYV